MNPAITHVLKYFAYAHLLAHVVAERAPQNPETTVALRKLLEAKDAAVRASLP